MSSRRASILQPRTINNHIAMHNAMQCDAHLLFAFEGASEPQHNVIAVICLQKGSRLYRCQYQYQYITHPSTHQTLNEIPSSWKDVPRNLYDQNHR
mmetsp:Transcript_13690/g.37667  ORF Transcript_13690/g.37667 Transcript_13690/m.37667 type:complete len:96 (+) Transcript_13690:306-593(+)